MSISGFYQLALKMLASGLLVWIATLCLWGLYRIWLSKDLVYRNFAYTRDGTDDTAAGQHFTQLTNFEIRKLHELLGPPKGADTPLIIPTVNLRGGQSAALALPSLPESLLPSIEIKAYGIQLSALLNQILQQVDPPNEVIGTITETKAHYQTYVELHRAGASRAQEVPASLSPTRDTKEDAAFTTACRIYRMLATDRGMIYTLASDAEFEAFARALGQYQLYRATHPEVWRSPQIAEDALKETERILGGLIQQKTHFPLVYKLAALVARSKGQIKEAIADLETYQSLWPKNLAEDENAKNLLAQYQQEDRSAPTIVAMAARESRERRVRPVRPGTSVSSTNETAGTICCIVTDGGAGPDGPRYILSADHILGTTIGAHVLQPGMADGGKLDKDVIGEVARSLPSKSGADNRAAGTIARLTVASEPSTPTFQINGPPLAATLGMTVRKAGRTTGDTVGTITAVDVDAAIGYPDGIRTFHSLIRVQGTIGPFSQPGDSGAPVVAAASNQLIGFVYAGSGDQNTTFVMPIGPVLDGLGVELVPPLKGKKKNP